MSDELWIVIPNWDKFQHYKDREPAWIKLYLELNGRDEWRRLTLSERGLLVTAWLSYAASGGRTRVTDLGSRAGTRVRLRQVEALVQAGFLALSASKPLALTRARAGSREPSALREEKSARGLEEKTCPKCGIEVRGKTLAEHLEDVHAEYEFDFAPAPEVIGDDFAERVRTLIRSAGGDT